MNRRRFLKLTGQGAAAWLFSRANYASGLQRGITATRFFVHIRTRGGMDVTLGLDPLTHSMYNTTNANVFLEYRPEEIARAGALTLGPAAAEALKPFAESISLVRGVHMRQDIQHEPMNEFWVRASLAGSSSAFVMNLAERLDSDVLVSERLTNLTRVQQTLVGQDNDSGLTALGANDWASIKAGRAVSTGLERLARTGQLQSQAKQLIDGKLAELGEGADPFLRQALITAVYMTQGIGGLAVLDLNRDFNTRGNLDTHTNHIGMHLNVQRNVWNLVAEVFKIFQQTPYQSSGSLFDQTTFVVTSEFSRTPYLNSARGKDHNVFTNAVLFAGAGIKPGVVTGASRMTVPQRADEATRSRHTARLYDFKAGRALELAEMRQLDLSRRDPSIALIHPEDVMATAVEASFGSSVRGLIAGRLLNSVLKGS